ncbi:MAG: prolipoprotein diacylglyceryl transferase [Desulfovibrionales bacterium]
MFPILVNIGPVTIYTYGFFIAAAFLAGMVWAAREADAKGLDPKIVFDVGFYIVLSAILGSRLLYVLLNPSYFLQFPLEIFKFWKGGLVFLGGALLATAAVLLYFKRRNLSVWLWADCFAPGLALGQAIGRLGCFSAGCCYGKECELPWAATFSNPASLAPQHIPLHPTQLYHALAGLVSFGILLAAKRHLKQPGQLMGLFFVLYAFFRFTIEFFRDDYRGTVGFFSVTQVIAAAVLIIGVIIIYQRRA